MEMKGVKMESLWQCRTGPAVLGNQMRYNHCWACSAVPVPFEILLNGSTQEFVGLCSADCPARKNSMAGHLQASICCVLDAGMLGDQLNQHQNSINQLTPAWNSCWSVLYFQ